MDGPRFDAITAALVRTRSRRTALRLLTAASVSTLSVELGLREAETAHFACRHIDTRCQRDRQCCSGICRKKRCRGHDAGICAGEDTCTQGGVRCDDSNASTTCLCLVTTGDAPFCGFGFLCESCTRDKDCEDRGHGPKSACVRTTEGPGCPSGCASFGGTACSKPCPDPAQSAQ